MIAVIVIHVWREGEWLSYQFLSAYFRNLTNAINSTYYQAFTMRNVWESVVSEV